MRNSSLRVCSLAGVSSLVLLASLSTGCRGRGFLPAPGTMNQQQANAVVHDPYPLTDIGPNDQGSRPPSYQQPLPGPVRDRLSADAMPWLGR
ncbi:membrane or secreted protein [Rhodopirellula bahusiensis]|uniref:membrane or secreted protein n=2 Tax=Rhodopirellula bahusiensis TaxID=2014065 RepID=UPI001E3ED205|nr:membrane or secreted protein [Rhodopirellula bahusiensis]